MEAELRAEKLSKDAKFLDRLRRLRRNPPFTFTPEMYALHAQIEAEKAAKNAPRQAPKWTPMTLNRRGTR